MASRIAELSRIEQKELLRELSYLNGAEIKAICKRHGIPFVIVYETRDRKRRTTGETDRKGVMLRRLRHFLRTGNVLKPTCFRASVVCFDAPPEKPREADRLFYGQYDKSKRAWMALLSEFTRGEFRDGAIARILARHFWTHGKAPTFKEFAAAWLLAKRKHTRPNPEWAFLSDRADGTASADWKKMRMKKAKKVLSVLKRIKTARKTT
jgi:hypothetical protein